mmetsp:Transcript_36761/g.80346  ORF Transcript_36761/g.80346 Transcript_36761/m.80346 type:complete len:99 (+) Transcript_36761:379-675(+)
MRFTICFKTRVSGGSKSCSGQFGRALGRVIEAAVASLFCRRSLFARVCCQVTWICDDRHSMEWAASERYGSAGPIRRPGRHRKTKMGPHLTPLLFLQI